MDRRMRRVVPGVLAIGALCSGLALAGPGPAPGNLDCNPSSPQIVVTEGQLTSIDASASVDCTGPGALPGQGMGPNDTTTTTPPPPKAGDSCGYTVTVPVHFTLASIINGGVVAWEYMPGGPFPGAEWGFHDLGVYAGSNALAWETYERAGMGTRYYFPWVFVGKYEGSPLACKPDPNVNLGFGLNPGWTSPCATGNGWRVPQCLVTFQGSVTISDGQAQSDGAGLVGTLDLQGLLHGTFTGGQVTSMPKSPNPGLVNADTCFYVSGMKAKGRPVTDVNKPLAFEIVLTDPNAADDQGRHAIFTLRIDVTYQGTVWNFGDGTTEQNPPPATPTCGTGPAGLPSAVHRYRTYSAAQKNGVFDVSVQHLYGIHVTAFWRDSAGSHHVDLGDGGVPQLTVDAAPRPYPMRIVQEEGVPIG